MKILELNQYYIYIYIYINTEMDRSRERDTGGDAGVEGGGG